MLPLPSVESVVAKVKALGVAIPPGPVRVDGYGDSESLSEELLALIRCGKKRAGTGLFLAYEIEGTSLPNAGDIEIVMDHRLEPALVTRITSVEIVPYQNVSAAYAAIEGEGDGSLEFWRKAHWAFFSRECWRRMEDHVVGKVESHTRETRMPPSAGLERTMMILQTVTASILCSLLAGSMAFASDSPPRASVPLAPPAQAAIPRGPLGQAIQYGQQLVTATGNTARSYVGNALRCASCHLDGGRTAYAAPLVGLTGLFPEYASRRGSVESLEDRINDCFLRSMNGKALPAQSREMIGLLAYIAWLSQGVPTGSEVEGRGFREIRSPGPADVARGKTIYLARCASCHGDGGQGVQGTPGNYVFPPLWGSQSFNIGAGMARLSVAAAFVQAKMPVGSAGTLTDQEAYDVAAYFTTQPRPDFAGKRNDWPKGGRPADAR